MDGKELWLTLSQQSLQYKQGQPSQRRRQKSLKTFVKTEHSLCVHSTCEEASDKKHCVVVSKKEDHLSIIVVVKGCPQRGRSTNHHLFIIVIIVIICIIICIITIITKRGESPIQPRRGGRAQGGTTSCQFWENPRLQVMFDWFRSES